MTCPCSLGKPECDCGLQYSPAGRVLIPGADATPHADKDLRWLSWVFTAVILGVGMAAVFWPGRA